MKIILHAALIALFVTVLFAVVPASAAVDMVVIRSEGAPFEPGSMIDGSVPLKLEAGWTVTLVASDGTHVTLSGPSERAPAEGRDNSGTEDPKIINVLGALIADREKSTLALGSVRSTGGGDFGPLPDAWAVNVENSGSWCIRREQALLWRHDATNRARLTVRLAAGARTAQADWAAGRNTLSLSGAGFRDRTRYMFELDGKRTELMLHVMRPDLTTAVEQAAWMAEAGCKEQALAMLEAIR